MPGALHAGNSISHYRVISPLGSGGMGEVYMAQDQTLERAVALKILPPALVKNEERLRRFMQEAKSASSLSHPHIVTIYEIGQAPVRSADGAEPEPADGAPIHFIAMELISGETLKQRIHGDKTDLRTLLRYMAQAAEGLAKAHSAGIVHRDLKPENIMISKDGYAKVLDFGLAKLTERREAGEDATSLPTTTREGTRAGAIMGTVGYMSPEQVRGKVVDHRSDIFSFGCILYEASARRRPFVADSEVETMHLILNDQPPPVEEANPEVPNALRRLIRRCLAKAPDQRLHSMKDLALQLNDLVEEFDELPLASGARGSSSSASSPVVAEPPRRSPLLWIGVSAVAVIGLLVIILGFYGLRQRHAVPVSNSSSFQSMKMTQLTSNGNVRAAALSPDGKYVVNTAEGSEGRSLWIRQVATGSDVEIVPPLPTPYRGISFSPDGDYVYYVNQETAGPGYATLYQVPVLGGTARKLLFDIDSAPSFSPDGKQLVFARGYPQNSESVLMLANADGTGERKLAARKDPYSFLLQDPSWSPDGTQIIAAAVGSEGGAHHEVISVDVDTGKQEVIGDKHWFGINGIAWLPDKSGLVLTASDQRGDRSQQVWFLSYPDGRARRISNDLNDYDGISVTADSKAIATTQTHRVSNLWVVPEDTPGDARQVTFGSGREDAIGVVRAASADSVVFTAPQGDSVHLWRIESKGGPRTQLTPGSGFHFDPAVSHNGDVIAFVTVGEDGIPHIWTMDADGGNLTQRSNGESGENDPALSPDGQWLVHGSVADKGLYRVSLRGGETQTLADDIQGSAVYSPDGKQIAYRCFIEEAGKLRSSAKIIPAEGGEATRVVPFTEGFGLHWTPAGDALTYQKITGGVSNIWRLPLDGSSPQPITDFKSGIIFSYDWSPDGKQIYLSRGSLTSDVVLISDFR